MPRSLLVQTWLDDDLGNKFREKCKSENMSNYRTVEKAIAAYVHRDFREPKPMYDLAKLDDREKDFLLNLMNRHKIKEVYFYD